MRFDQDTYGGLMAAALAAQEHTRQAHPETEMDRRAQCNICRRIFESTPDASALQQGIHHLEQEHLGGAHHAE
jgi:hypothetical protein